MNCVGIPRSRVLSNQGTYEALKEDETVGESLEVIVGQHIWFATNMPAGSTLYLELRVIDPSGLIWVPMHEFPAEELIAKDGVVSGSMSIDLLSGDYRVTATEAGGRSWLGRLGTPYP